MERSRVLFLTNAELGQANVQLAVLQELLQQEPSLDLHISSFTSLSSSIDDLNKTIHPSKITFHSLQGPTWKEALFHRPEHRWNETCALAPTCWNAPRAAPMMIRIILPWNQDEVVDLVQQIDRVVETVKPDLIIVDNLFTPAITVCYQLQFKWSVLSPNSYREFILGDQTPFDQWYKHPPTASLLPFPVPFYLRPSAWYHNKQYMKLINDEWLIAHARNVQAKTNKPYSDWGKLKYDRPAGLKIILPSNSDVDFPFDVVPDHVVSCGPIVRPAAPVEQEDPELALWLKKRPTVYINLGTHALYDQATTQELVGAIQDLLKESDRQGQSLQVLWKANKGQESEHSADMVNGLRDDGRIRMVHWLHTEPISILQSGHVICSVNHGGANSYFEAVSAGVTQVVLPVWFDTYDFARRVDYLGIGLIGNRRNAPKCARSELGPVLIRAVFGTEARRMRNTAAAIAKSCRATGGGREIAAQAILELLSN